MKSLLSGLKKLNSIISKQLVNNGFQNNFIKKAIINFEIPIESAKYKNTIYCYPFLEDEDGKIYNSVKVNK
jgi:hypothetical protein